MNAFEALRKKLESTGSASGVLLISHKDAREILDMYDRLHAAAREFHLLGRQMSRLAEPSEPTAAGPRPAA